MKTKLFRVYYFVGEPSTGKGEVRKSTILSAETEAEARRRFKNEHPRNFNFGWAEEIEEE